MWEQIVNALVPVLITAIVAILVAVIKALGDALVGLIEKKREAVIAQIGTETYNQRLDFARSAWRMVDEYFRISPKIEKTIDAAQAKFTEYIKQYIPDITDDEIEQIRQAVAGEFNEGKEAISKVRY